MKKQTLGAVILSLRKEHGLTQAELGEKMGVTDKAVSKRERDLSYSDIDSFSKLAEIFGVSVNELLQIKEQAEQGTGRKKFGEILDLIFRAIALAMGIAVVVLSILKEIDVYTVSIMLGIGMSCMAITLLDNNGDTARN